MSTTDKPDVSRVIVITTGHPLAAILSWSDADLRRLAALASLGAPSTLAASPGSLTCERDTDPGDVPALRPVLDAKASARAEALAAWRVVARWAGVPLPVPGKVGT